ncbi:hypothetical protein EGW08_017817 [Elysia chlorotica]|uniref:C-type lectin domain-containing protein n=1 Tax=Elysia chlorotica TaxID=188477 RepID=A0A3S1B2E8_ELYCH|nr:hypothetical protein EGW08_017817 [Elysia chlorotica]
MTPFGEHPETVFGQSECRIGWKLYQGYCYGLARERLSWSEAQNVCSAYGGSLAEVHSKLESDFIKSLFVNASISNEVDGVWIGGSDIFSEGSWEWVGSKISITEYTDWGPNEPNSIVANGREDCLSMWKDMGEDCLSMWKDMVTIAFNTVHLGYRKVSARWVPRQLTVEMKAQRKTICTQLLERFTHDGERFLRSIITGDESWVHHYDPESKMQSMQYRHKNSPAPKKFKVVASARKVLLTIFWDMEGIVHIEFLEQGTTINSERYVSTLRALKGRLRRVRQDKVKDVVIQHDNARPHTSRLTQCALQQLELPTIPHPPYSPDLAPSDFFLFPLLKKHLKGNHYETYAEDLRLQRERMPAYD